MSRKKKRIPSNLEECFLLLNQSLNRRDRKAIREMTEDEFSFESHFGLGMGIRNEWFRGGDGVLIEYLKKEGLTFPIHLDDISDVIIRAYHRSLIGVDIDIKGLVASISNKDQEKESEYKENVT